MGSEWLWQGRDRRQERLSLCFVREELETNLTRILMWWCLKSGLWSVPDASELFLSCCLSHGKSPASGTNSLLTTTNVTDQLSSSPACLVIFYLLIIHHQHSHYDGAFLVAWKFKFLTLIKMKCIFNFRWADGTFGQESVGQFMSSLVFLFCS